MSATPRAALTVLLGVVVVDLIGFGIVMPVLPYLAEEYGASPFQLGLMLSAYAAAQFVFAPLWGRLSDRVGRRPVLLATIAGTALSLLALGLADSLLAIFASRLLAGAFAANVSVASAYVADATREEERTRWMGLIGAAFGIGFLLGPAIGAALSPWGHHVPMLAAAGLAAANLLHALLRLPETQVRRASAPVAVRSEVLRAAPVRWLTIANLVFALSVTQLETVFQLFLMDRFRYDAWQTGLVMVAMAAVMAGVQGGAMKPLVKRWSERSLVASGALAMTASFALLPWTQSLLPLLAVLAVAAFGRAVTQPSLMSLVSMAAPASERGVALGVFQSAASLARIFGPLAAGWLYGRSLAAPFWLAAALAVGVSLLARGLPQRPDVAEAALPSAGA